MTSGSPPLPPTRSSPRAASQSNAPTGTASPAPTRRGPHGRPPSAHISSRSSVSNEQQRSGGGRLWQRISRHLNTRHHRRHRNARCHKHTRRAHIPCSVGNIGLARQSSCYPSPWRPPRPNGRRRYQQLPHAVPTHGRQRATGRRNLHTLLNDKKDTHRHKNFFLLPQP